MKSMEVCNDEQRREKVRDSDLSGLDYIEVSEDQLKLTAYFLGKAPKELDSSNLIIEGGRRVRNIEVIDVEVHREDPDLDDWMEITLNKAGDFSTYTLRIVAPKGYDGQGQLAYEAFPGIDRRYSQVDFSFKAGCANDLDCQTTAVCPTTSVVEPEINYLAKDYASFRRLLLDRLALTIPGWQETHVPDIGITLVEILAYAGDYLSYYQDAVSTEAYLGTARQRISVRRHVRLIDYHIHEGCNARAWLALTAQDDIKNDQLLPDKIYFISGGSTDLLQDSAVQRLPQGSYQVFEPLVEDPTQPLRFYKVRNEIRFYTWDDQQCCLPRGATSATLQDWCDDNPGPVLHLKPGDFLLFEEVKGAKTGQPADANPTHRHVVRLTGVQPTQDELYDKNVLEITWNKADALPFPL
ncbi:MAG TPA: putative baseplate assembly protein, partial [Ktedonobacteraceae bacterium]|nr:putative baseplate assembly protein [Ktedonobacteraceae bacterium]